MKWNEITVKSSTPGWGERKFTLRYSDEEDGTRTWQQKDVRNVSFYGETVEEAIAELRNLSKDMTDATLDSDFEYGTYGDRDRDVLNLTGWNGDVNPEYIKAAEAEIKAIPARAKERRDQERQRAKDQMERLLAEYPDLNK